MKNLFIPPLNTEITLAQDWTFDLYGERGNYSLFSALKTPPPKDSRGFYDERQFTSVTLPAGTALTLRTYRIRLGQHDYAHVTFTATLNGKGRRFWVKLADANKIVFDAPGAPAAVQRTGQQIVDQTEELARALALYDGYESNESFLTSENPRAIGYWKRACIAQEHLTATDPMDAASELEDAAPGQEPEWAEFERISDLPDVDEAMRGFAEDQTGDNATCLVRAIINAARKAGV